jgi:hypothetical protein
MKTRKHPKSGLICRRTFLHCSAVAASAAWAAPLLVPARTLGGPAAPGNRIAVGFIGVGRQAVAENIPLFFREPDAQLVAVCDVDSWRLAQAKEQVENLYRQSTRSGLYKGCLAFRDWRELIARKDIDALMISTPDHWHVPIALAAVRAGKDVALEKPITRCIQEGRLLAEVVAKHQRVFRVDSEFRSLPPFVRVVELVRNGRLGKIRAIRTGSPPELFPAEVEQATPAPAELDYDLWLGPAPLVPYLQKRVHTPHNLKNRGGWMRNLDYCDGMICNWGAHLNDIAQWANNTERTGPVEVEATGKFHNDKVWNVLENFDARYRFANGVELFYQMGQPRVRFEGERGWLQITYPNRLETSDPAILKEELGPDEIHFPIKTEKRDFLDGVKSRGQTLEDAEVGQRTTTLCHLAHIAIKLGGIKLRWDPETERFPDNEAANQLLARPALRAPWKLE